MRRLHIVILFLIIFINLKAQENEEFKSWKDRIFFGGNIGLSFGSVTDIEISPIVGYNITQRWAMGTGFMYEYYKRNEFNIETHIYGGSIFTRFTLFPNFSMYFPVGEGLSMFAHTEYQGLSLEEKYFKTSVDINERTGRYILHSFLIGGGLTQKLGRRGGFNITVLWNLNYTEDSPYNNPVIRVGFIF